MSCIVSTKNVLRGGTVISAAGGALPTAPGYSSSDVIDGTVERCWRRGVAVNRHQIMVELPAAGPCEMVAVFDLRPIGSAATVQYVQVYTSTGDRNGPHTLRGYLDFNSARGDGSILLPSWTQIRTVYLDVFLSAPSDVILGEMWAGHPDYLPLAPVQIGRHVERAVSMRESMGGTTWATKRAEPRLSISLPFPPLDDKGDGNHAFASVFEAAGGRLRSVVVIPDSSVPSAVYHGRLVSADGSTMAADHYWRGRALEFTESGRVLRG